MYLIMSNNLFDIIKYLKLKITKNLKCTTKEITNYISKYLIKNFNLFKLNLIKIVLKYS